MVGSWAAWGCGGSGPAKPNGNSASGTNVPQSIGAASASAVGSNKASPTLAVNQQGLPDIAPGTWTMAFDQLRFPATLAAGKIHNQSFAPDKILLEDGILVFRQGKDFFADLEVKIFLFLKSGEVPEKKSYTITADSPLGNPHIQIAWKEGTLPKTQFIIDKYVMKLEFDGPAHAQLPGRVYLCLPDASKSYLAGTFAADVVQKK
jgi:hypothetical protein